jgi:hypothetical protein
VTLHIDLGTWPCITPYIGGGLGFANINVVGFKDVNVPKVTARRISLGPSMAVLPITCRRT